MRKSERGLLSLEACIAVTIFIFLMLFMYSFFVVFEARNAIGHAVLATANSLALDSYENSRLGEADTVAKLIFQGLYGISHDADSDFSNANAWYNDSTISNEDGTTSLSDDFSDAIKTRFYAYLCAGEDESPESVLKRYHIKGGESGMDFSNSYADSKNLYLSVQYTIEYEFQVFNLEGLRMEQKACSKLWKP